MATVEKELPAGYEWELDFSCSRCGSTHSLIFDKENEMMYCGPCLLLLHSLQKAQSPAREEAEAAEEELLFQ